MSLSEQNIEDAIHWVLSQSLGAKTILTEKFVRRLHQRMFGKIWAWAGGFRKTNKNLGVDKWQIPTSLNTLLNDTLYWIEHETFTPVEIALRFKHRLLSIHCFPNGNGRHSRLMADIIIDKIYKLPVFSWGAGNLVEQNESPRGRAPRYLDGVCFANRFVFSFLTPRQSLEEFF